MAEAPAIEKTAKRKTGRSPAYPGFSLKRALEQADALFKQEGEYEAPLSSTVGAWGYSEKSSGGRQALATMKYYGLIDISGDGPSRMVKISDIAKRILLDKREDQTEKNRLIRQVALNPAAHASLFQKYGQGLASDGSVEHFLVFEEGFKPGAAKDLLAEYKDTAEFAGLYQPSDGLDKVDQQEDDGVQGRSDVQVGDKIQATVGGIDQFPNGAIVLGFSDDGEWVFTDQSTAGVSISDVEILEIAVAKKLPPQIPAHLVNLREDPGAAQPKGTRKAIFPLDEGDVTLIFPEGISSEGLEDLGAYLEIFLKKEIKKSKLSA